MTHFPHSTLPATRASFELVRWMVRAGADLHASDEAATVAAPKRPRKPSIAKMIAQAEKSGRTVTSVVMPDGTRLNFGEPEPSTESNPWFADLRTETKQ